MLFFQVVQSLLDNVQLWIPSTLLDFTWIFTNQFNRETFLLQHTNVLALRKVANLFDIFMHDPALEMHAVDFVRKQNHFRGPALCEPNLET